MTPVGPTGHGTQAVSYLDAGPFHNLVRLARIPTSFSTHFPMGVNDILPKSGNFLHYFVEKVEGFHYKLPKY